MGQGIANLVKKAVPSDEDWSKSQRGPGLRKLFGGYLNADIWAVYRRYRQVDDGNGFLSYDEYRQIMDLEEFNLLFVWDIFSQQVSLFSSAKLGEKGRFLMTLYDQSSSGTCTGAEIATLCSGVFSVLSKCNPAQVKAKEARSHLKSEIATMIPAFKECMDRGEHGGSAEAIFQMERLIGQNEMEMLLKEPAIVSVYEGLPLAKAPPPGTMPPPAPDWSGGGKKQEKVAARPAGGGTAAAKSLSKSGSTADTRKGADFRWMTKIDDDMPIKAKQPEHHTKPRGATAGPPAAGKLVVHGVDFAPVAKDLANFRRLFIRSTSAALGIPAGCVEVLNVKGGSVVVEFLLRSRAGDVRDATTLMLTLQIQVGNCNSAWRKGPFKKYAESAELIVDGQSSGGAIEDNLRPETATTEVQTDDVTIGEAQAEAADPSEDPAMQAAKKKLEQALAEVESMRQKLEQTEGEKRDMEEDMAQKDTLISQLFDVLDKAGLNPGGEAEEDEGEGETGETAE